MTQRDLPKRGVSEATVTPPPTVTASTGAWIQGFEDHITESQKHQMMLMFGLTVDPDVIQVNGRQHIIDQLDNNLE